MSGLFAWWRWAPDPVSVWVLENDPNDRRRTHRVRRSVYRRVARSRVLAVCGRVRVGIGWLWVLWLASSVTALATVAALDGFGFLRFHLEQSDYEQLVRSVVVRPLPLLIGSWIIAAAGTLSVFARDWHDHGYRPSMVERVLRWSS